MEDKFAYFIGGKIIIITKDEGERSLHYNIRLKFIIERLGMEKSKFKIDSLETYSRIYVNKCFFGVKYPQHIEIKLTNLVNSIIPEYIPLEEHINTKENINTQKVNQQQKQKQNLQQKTLEKFQAQLENEIIESADENEIVLENGTILTPFDEDGKFQLTAESDETGIVVPLEIENLTGEETAIENFEQLDSNQNINLTEVENIIDSLPEDIQDEPHQFKIQSCVDDECDIPAGVTLTTPNGVQINIEPPQEEETNSFIVEQEIPVVKQEIPVVVEQEIRFLNVGDDNGYLALEYPSSIVIRNVDNIDFIYESALQYCVAIMTGNKIENGTEVGKLKVMLSKQNVSRETMYECNYQKFAQNHELRQKLFATGNSEIIYNNTNATYWGKTWGLAGGDNLLGKILMEVRSKLRESEPVIETIEENTLPKIDEIKVPVVKKTGTEIRSMLLEITGDKTVTLDDGKEYKVIGNRGSDGAMLDEIGKTPYERIVAINGIPL